MRSWLAIIPKAKLARANLALILILLGGILRVELGPEPCLDSEKVFMGRLHNSLYYMDEAKHKWADEHNKSQDAVPIFNDLAPYLGEWKNTIEKLKAMGIEYQITSTETNQSDVPTLTRGMRFRAGICCFYRAGTTLCLHSGWTNPSTSAAPITFRIRFILLHGDYFLKAALFVLLLVNVVVSPFVHNRKSQKPT